MRRSITKVTNVFVILSGATLVSKGSRVVYYESLKRALTTKTIYGYRCDERLKGKDEGTTRLPYSRFLGGLEHLKIETRLIDERFVSVMGERVI